uniref:Uncharacterized protein n=1 Tax=Ochrobactrum phage ORM_20 TaxID=2985243 RepID=A0A9N6WVE5_9VIRU|nr:hypothetical protein ORM20_00158 [Ochrobactrum phage ORM_20]
MYNPFLQVYKNFKDSEAFNSKMARICIDSGEYDLAIAFQEEARQRYQDAQAIKEGYLE